MRRPVLLWIATAWAVSWGCVQAPSPRLASQTLIVAPFNFNQPVPEPLAPGLPILQQVISGTLESHGARVILPPFAEFHDTWLASAKEVGTLYDAEGDFDPSRFDAAAAALTKAYAARLGNFEALILPYLDVTRVAVRGGHARWDGVLRRVRIRFEDYKDKYLSLSGFDTPCTSLRIVAYASDGARLFERRRGLEVVHHFRVSPGFQVFQRDDLFRDPRISSEAARIALEPLFRD